jgi:replicative DNA helicase
VNDSVLELERTLLSTMMRAPGECWRVTAGPEHMATEQHADILAAIRERSSERLPVDPLSIADHFQQHLRPEMGHLVVDIAHRYEPTPVPEPYSLRIIEACRIRKARDIGAKLIKAATDADADEALAALMQLHHVESNHEFDAKQATQSAYAELNTLHLAGNKLAGITTGLADLDDKLGGLHNGDLVVVGARAAMGKTSFLLGMAISAAANGNPIGLISGEQPIQQIAMRMLSVASKVDAKKFRTAAFSESEWSKVFNAVAHTGSLPMQFLDRSAPTMAEVIRVARRWKHKHGIRALYVDYLQRIVGEGDRKFEQVGNVARGLKNLARDLDMPVVVLAQVSREVEKRANPVPKMGDLSDSSEIEKEADQVLMLFRPGYYDDAADQNVARIILDKNRHGPTGYVELAWNGPTMTFSDNP